MVDLDCESADSAMRSLAIIYETEVRELKAFFTSIDLEAHVRANNPELPSDQELQRLLELAVGPQQKTISKTFWFHLTRVPIGTTFEDGILPLNEALPKVWAMLDGVFKGTPHQGRLRQMHQEGVMNRCYALKVPNRFHWGPYAMLVREIAYCSDSVANHDYLKIPEIVEDICNGYASRFNEDIQSTVEQALVPMIVKFWVSEHEHMYGLTSAISYAYFTQNNKELRGSANTCFDGQGNRVPAERVVSVLKTKSRNA